MAMNLFQTETVKVITPNVTLDDLGEPTTEGEGATQEVEVLVCPGATSDLDATRPNGVQVTYTLHFPKTWSDDLKDCKVEVRGETYYIIGDPKPYTSANTPGEWYMPVEVTRTDG